MARPERNTVDYFPYLCDEGEKMYYIDNQYGNDGFATFIKILTALAKTDFHYLDLSKKTTQMFLSAKCKVSTDVLNSIISDLAELGKFNLTLWNENKIIWCQDFIDSIQDAYKKRNNECITYDGLLILLDSLAVRKLIKLPTKEPVKPQSKVEYIKEEKRKEDDVIKPPSFIFFTMRDFEEQIEIGENEFTLHAVRQTKKTVQQLKEFYKEFILTQKALTLNPWKSAADAKKHFIYWVNKQPIKLLPSQIRKVHD